MISAIDERFFMNLKRLEKISIRNSKLSMLTAKHFINNDLLQQFSIVFNNSTMNGTFMLSEEFMANKPRLTYFQVSKTELKHLPQTVFTNSTNIEEIDLSFNMLSQLSGKVFIALKKLKAVDLSENFWRTWEPSNKFHGQQLNSELQFGVEYLQAELLLREISLVQSSPFSVDQLFLNRLNINHFKFDARIQSAQIVELMYNPIETLEIWFDKQRSNAMTFDLSQSKLASNAELILHDLQPFDNITIIMKTGLLVCGFKFRKLLELRDRHQRQTLIDFGDTTCKEPIGLRGVYARDLKAADVPPLKAYCFNDCICKREMSKTLTMDCSNRNLTSLPALESMPSFNSVPSMLELTMDVRDNSLRKLPAVSDELELRLIYTFASNNVIEELSSENFGNYLEILDLRNNRLKSMPKDVVLRMNYIEHVYLGGNQWHCDCSTIEFFRLFKLLNQTLDDYNETVCANIGRRFADLEPLDVCIEPIYIFSGLGLVFGCICISIGFFYKYQKDIKIFLFAHKMCLWLVKEEELDEDKPYDAFICFAGPDQAIVEDIIFELEKESNGFKCLIGVRDWPIGEMIPELITESVEQSRRTIVFISQNFIASPWCKHEFRVAQTEEANKNRNRIIVITHRDIEESELMDQELKSYLRLFLYIKYEDPRFWQKLLYAMPHKTGYLSRPLVIKQLEIMEIRQKLKHFKD